MSFKVGDIVKINFKNIELWTNHIGDFVDFRNDIFEVRFIRSTKCCHKSDFEKCALENKCDRECSVKLYSIIDFSGYELCEYDLVKATEREQFLYRMYGSEALRGKA